MEKKIGVLVACRAVSFDWSSGNRASKGHSDRRKGKENNYCGWFYDVTLSYQQKLLTGTRAVLVSCR